MPNPLWIPGSESPNKSGRPKHSVKTPKGLIERFVKRNFSPRRLSEIVSKLSPKEQMDVFIEMLPYHMAKKNSEGISSEEIDRLYEMIQTQITSPNAKAV